MYYYILKVDRFYGDEEFLGPYPSATIRDKDARNYKKDNPGRFAPKFYRINSPVDEMARLEEKKAA